MQTQIISFFGGRTCRAGGKIRRKRKCFPNGVGGVEWALLQKGHLAPARGLNQPQNFLKKWPI